jgi:hypothetical protein
MAERNGLDLRLLLCSADRLSEAAIFFGLRCANTLRLRSSASLSRVTRADHFRPPRLRRSELGFFAE